MADLCQCTMEHLLGRRGRDDWTLMQDEDHLCFHFHEAFPISEGTLVFTMEVCMS